VPKRRIASVATVAAVTLLGVAAVAGCGESAAVDPRVLGLTGHPIVQDREVAMRAAAEEALTGQCMAASGFEYPEASFDEIMQERKANVSEPYGFMSRASVARAVRGDASRDVEGPSIRAKDRYKRSLGRRRLAAYQRAYYGTPGPNNVAEVKLPDGGAAGITLGGCHGRALRTLYRDVPRWTRLEGTADYLRQKIVHETIETSEVTDAVRAWSQCAGQSVGGDNPFAAAHTARKAALADQDQAIDVIWRCERRSRLVETAMAAERRIAQSVTREYERDLLAYREQSRAAATRAEHVLASGS
jgi:hypothetical protein